MSVPSELQQFWSAWALPDDSPTCGQLRGRFLALWEHKPNKSGGARNWRVETSSLITIAGKWATEAIALAWLPAPPTTQDLVLHLLKQMARSFRSNAQVSWKPWLAFAMGLTRVPKEDLMVHMQLGLPSWAEYFAWLRADLGLEVARK